MIKATKNIFLKEILSSDSETLFKLMQDIYPPAYKHFWTDAGEWYVNTQYSKENILKELSDENAAYYFIIYNGEIVGNFRIIWDEKLEDLSEKKQVKLHRIYLHQKIQGLGIGKTLLSWLEQKALQKSYNVIWLDAMNAQPQALQFYKKQAFKYHSHTYLSFKNMLDEFRKMNQLYKKLI